MLKNYIKISFKVLQRRKFFTAISLVGISFTLVILMVLTAIFDHTFGPQPPEVKKSTTLGMYSAKIKFENGGQSFGPTGYPFHDKYVRTLPNLKNYSIFQAMVSQIITYYKGKKIEAFNKRTDGRFWEILEYEFLEGGPITRDDNENANFVCVINAEIKEKFFEDEDAIGKQIEIDGRYFRVKGVVKNVPINRLIPFSDIWVPLSTNPNPNYLTDWSGMFQSIIEVNDPADFAEIKSEFQYRVSNIDIQDRYKNAKFHAHLDTFFEYISRTILSLGEGEAKTSMLLGILMFFALLFMLLPAINLVNLNSSRIMERASEIGVRKAFGASSHNLVWQFITENVILTFIGGVIGLILSGFVLDLINTSNIIQYSDFSINMTIFLYGTGITLFFGVFSGVLPAWRMSKLHPVEALKGDSE